MLNSDLNLHSFIYFQCHLCLPELDSSDESGSGDNQEGGDEALWSSPPAVPTDLTLVRASVLQVSPNFCIFLDQPLIGGGWWTLYLMVRLDISLLPSSPPIFVWGWRMISLSDGAAPHCFIHCRRLMPVFKMGD